LHCRSKKPLGAQGIEAETPQRGSARSWSGKPGFSRAAGPRKMRPLYFFLTKWYHKKQT
jgi:hypothetical protein